MAAWTPITADDVATRLADAELDAYRTLELGEDQPDPLPEIIVGVVQEVRNALAQNERNMLSAAENKLPRGAHHHALAMIRYRLISRLPVLIDEPRRREYEDALAWLRSRPLVEQPDDVAAEQLAGLPRPSATPRDHHWRLEDQDGI